MGLWQASEKGTSVCVCVCVYDVGYHRGWVICVSMHVWMCFSHILSEFASPYSCVYGHTCVHLFVGHACLCVCVCVFQWVEGLVQPPDGEYRFCLAPSLINFFSDWLWLLINKTWSQDQMQISSRGVEGDCWLLFRICLFLAPLPSTLDWRAEKGQFFCAETHAHSGWSLWSCSSHLILQCQTIFYVFMCLFIVTYIFVCYNKAIRDLCGFQVHINGSTKDFKVNLMIEKSAS